MKKHLFVLLIGLVALVARPPSAVAQVEVAGTLTGTVADASGAVIRGATITVHNDDTNSDSTPVATDGSGNWTVPNLQPGRYTVTVRMSGFRETSSANIPLHVGEHRRVNVELQPGTVTERVTVEASSTPIQTTTAEQSGTITGTQVRELELNNRNYEQLVTLQPGVVSGLPDQVGFGLENSSVVLINGARYTANNWTVDGADINDTGDNAGLLNVPSVDAIQEFTLQRSTYDAEYGRSGGGQIVVATKSGTSQFHGDLYEFVRNDVFDANSFLNNASDTAKTPLRYNDFGFTVGGPLFIPKLYPRRRSKTFFFLSEEWRRNSVPQYFGATVPTPAELGGTIPGQLTGQQIATAPAGCLNNNPNGTFSVSPTCFSHNSTAYINGIYSKFTPNLGANRFISTETAINNYHQDLVRLDQNIGDRVHLYGRYMQDSVPTTEPGGLFAGEPLPGISSSATNAPGKNVVANMTWTISPSLVNEVAFNYSWGAINSTDTGLVANPAFTGTLVNNFPYPEPYGLAPTVNIAGYTGVVLPYGPYRERNIDKNIADNVSIVLGNHSLRTGISVQWLQKTENEGSAAGNPTLTFNDSSYTGNSIANFLLGDAATYYQNSRDIIPFLHFADIDAYLQDDWKVTPRFTLNLGVHYSFFPSPQDNGGVLNNFVTQLFNPSTVPAIDPVSGNFVAGQSITPANYVNGIIFPSNSCTSIQKLAPVVCSPYGPYINNNPTNNLAPRIGFAWDLFGNGKTALRGGYGMFYDRAADGPWEQNAQSDPPVLQSTTINNANFDNPLGGSVVAPLGPATLHAMGASTYKTPYYQDWNLSLQDEILKNTKLEIAYVGSKGTDLQGEIDLNQVPASTRLLNPTANANALRPYLGYAGIADIGSMFNSNYNSLQVSLNRQVSSGLTFGLAYTWSKALTNAAQMRSSDSNGSVVYNTYDIAQNYGLAPFNTPQVFIANFVYQLPFFKDQKGFAGKLLGGWEISGIVTIESGQSLSITQYADPFDLTLPNGNSNGGIGMDDISSFNPRADVVGPISYPKQAPNGPSGFWFNPSAFSPASNHFGTAAPGIVRGPGDDNWDLAAIRNIRLAEHSSLQFRGEFFNTFNHVNFSSIDTNVNDPTFGQVNATHDPRVIQLGLKLYF